MKCCDMTAGMLKEPIEFKAKVRTPDGAGGYTEALEVISGAPVRAYVKQLSSRERWASERIEGISTHKIVIRYTDLVNETHIATIRGRDYNLDPPNNVEFADKWLEITARLGVAV